MNSKTASFSISLDYFPEHQLTIRGDRTAFDGSKGTLFVSDIHLGKAETFQKQGYSIPRGDDQATLNRLNKSVKTSKAKQLVILGDLFHSPQSITIQRFNELVHLLCEAVSIPVTLIRGNHDRFPDKSEINHYLQVVSDPFEMLGWQCCHQPPIEDITSTIEKLSIPWLAGHIHPVSIISVPGENLRLPCFACYPSGIVLPAFGSFTGGYVVHRASSRGSYNNRRKSQNKDQNGFSLKVCPILDQEIMIIT